MLPAGLFDQLVTIRQRGTTVRNGKGENVAPWVDYLPNIYARAKPVRAQEIHRAGQAHTMDTVVFTVRYRPGITDQMQVVWNGKPYGITALVNVEGRGEDLEITATAGGRDGR